MAQNTQELRYELAKRELLALDRAKGHVLACVAGEIWITAYGSTQDVVLKPGQCWRVENAEAVVASALKASVVLVAHPCEAAPRLAPRVMVEGILRLLKRWQHPPLAAHSSLLLR